MLPLAPWECAIVLWPVSFTGIPPCSARAQCQKSPRLASSLSRVGQATLSHIFKTPSLLLLAVCSPCLGHPTLTSALAPLVSHPVLHPEVRDGPACESPAAKLSLPPSSSLTLVYLRLVRQQELSRLRTSVRVISSFNTWTRKCQLVTNSFHKLKSKEPFQASKF